MDRHGDVRGLPEATTRQVQEMLRIEQSWQRPGAIDAELQVQRDGRVVRIVIDHPCYQAQAVLSETTRRAIMHAPD